MGDPQNPRHGGLAGLSSSFGGGLGQFGQGQAQNNYDWPNQMMSEAERRMRNAEQQMHARQQQMESQLVGQGQVFIRHTEIGPPDYDPRTLSIREILQKEIDEWLAPIKIPLSIRS